ncbi:MAG: type I DNA topoisomerase [Candidatus Omnitrophica bacterium]|nr:type I DNA topoisomerase [Candidatus Omnitrophota bacterium]
MAKHLVIVESPAKAKTINKYLGKDYEVEASMGHIRDLPKSKMGVDVAKDFAPHYIIIQKARKTVKNLLARAKGKNGIFLAPDPDREGEAISWHLAHILKDAGAKIKRVVFNEITKDAVKEAFNHPREIDLNLVNAQQARRIMDRILGYELSPLLWRNVSKGLSAGRVQSVALRLIVEREKEIRDFKPVEYWSLKARLSSQREEEKETIFTAKLDKIGEDKAELKNAEITNEIKSKIEKENFRVAGVDEKQRKRKAQAPFTTSKLQQEAYNRLRFPAAKTMRIAQKLYEGIEIGEEAAVGLITYMRTDSVNISNLAQKEAREFILDKYGEKFYPESPNVYKSKKSAQEAHEAIRPSSVLREPEQMRQFLDNDEFRLYDLIWKRFVSSQMTEGVDLVTSVSVVAGEKYFFKASGTKNLFPGFLIVYQNTTTTDDAEEESDEKSGKKDSKQDLEDEEKQELPKLHKNEALDLHQLTGTQHFTKPPARYNDASLVKTLEEKGIGRPSTYAPTIYTILTRSYVERKGGALIPTELGDIVTELLVKHFPKILNYDFTALMEEELDKIEEGGIDWIQVLKDFHNPFEEQLALAKTEMKSVKQEPVATHHLCESCGKPMLIRWGRFGQFLACSAFPECKFTASLPTDVKCPEKDCGGYLIKRRSGKGRTFYGCQNYPRCTYTTNKLPKKEEEIGSDEKPPESEEMES